MKIKNFDLLKKQDIQIRNIRREDLDQIMKWYNNEDVTYFIMDPLKKRNLLWEQYYQLFAAGMLSIEYIIETLKGEVKGLVRLFFHSHIATINIFGKEKEYLLNAGNILLEYCFNEQVSRIETQIMEDDVFAFQIYKELNFREEGILKEMIFYEGVYKDVYLLSLLRKEYKKK